MISALARFCGQPFAVPVRRLTKPARLLFHNLSVGLLLLVLTVTHGKEASLKDPEPPTFSVPAGVYTNDFALEIKAGSAVVRYSTDGSEPTVNSAICKGPIQITNCVVIRARAWYPNGASSAVVSENYVVLADELFAFSSNLPLVVVTSCDKEFAAAEKSLGGARVIVNNSAGGRVTLLGKADYGGLALLNVRGHSSLRYPKHSYNLKPVTEFIEPQKVSIFDLPKESDWVLYGPYPDKTLMRDVLAYELSNRMGRWAPRTRFVEVFINETGGKLSMEHYVGVYVFEEKISRDKERLNIAKLDPSENRPPEISGGYLFKKDHAGKYERKNYDADGPPQGPTVTNRTGYPSLPGGFPADPAGFLPPYVAKTNTSKPAASKPTTTARPASTRPKKPKPDPNRPVTNYVASAIPENLKVAEETVFHDDEWFRTTLQRHQFYYCEPEPDQITAVQRGWLKDYVNQFESALYGPSFTNASTGYRAFIDSDSFIDYHIFVEATKNVDGFRFSTFYYKDRNGRINMGPVWDWNLSFGNADGKQGWLTEHWLWPQLDDTQYPWFRRLFEDPDFSQRYVDRWAELRTNAFATSNLLARVDQLAALLDESQQRNFAKWEILGRHVNPNWYVGETFGEEVSWMKQWITNRLTWIDSQFLPAPVARVGKLIELVTTEGVVSPRLRPQQEGGIHFTLDGTDPRGVGGAVATNASRYEAPLSPPKNARIVARLQNGRRWSAPMVLWLE